MDKPVLITPFSAGLNSGSARYNHFEAGAGGTWSGGETNSNDVCAVAGTVKNLYVDLGGTAPGTGKSLTFTLYKNGSATTLAVTISDTNTTGNDTSHSITVAAGDTLSWEESPSGTPTLPTNLYMGCVVTGTSDGETFNSCGGPTANNSATRYSQPQGGTENIYDATENHAACVIPAAGTIDHLYVDLGGTAPGVLKSWVITAFKNGSSTTLTVTISGAISTTGNDTSHSFSVSAGDTVSFEIAPSGTPSGNNIKMAYRWTPTTNGESFQTTISTNVLSVGSNRYGTFISGQQMNDSSEATEQNNAPAAFTAKNAYVKVLTAPGSGESATYAFRKAGADSGPSVTISGTATTGSDTSNTSSVSLSDLINWRRNYTAGAATSYFTVGFVTLISAAPAPSPSVFNGNQFFQLLGVGI